MSDTDDKRSMWQIMTGRTDNTCELCLTTFSSAVSLECHTCAAVERQFPNGYQAAAPTPPTTPAAAARDALVAAAMKWREQWGDIYRPTDQTQEADSTDDELWAAARTYLAAQEPTP